MTGWLNKCRGLSILVLWLLGSCCAQTASTNPSQSDASTNPTLQATARAVVLDVVVVDGAGHSVDGLTKQDFVLEEDGAKQSIVAFEAVAADSKAGDHVPAPAAQNILLVDEMNAQFTDVAYARHRMEKLLRNDGAPLEQLTSLMVLTNEGLVVLQDATRDGNVLAAALNRHHPALPSRMLMAAKNNDSQRIAISLAALHELAAAASGSDVRKNLIWISPGFPILSSFVLGAQSRDFVFNEIRLLSVELLHARITVYTVDPRGVFVGADSGSTSPQASGPGVSSNPDVLATRQAFGQYVETMAVHGSLNLSDIALYQIAQETGGRSYWGRNDIDAAVLSSEREGAHFYSLSYYPSNRNFDNKFRKITVKVNRPGLKPRTRAGYFAIPDAYPPTREQITEDLKQALVNPVPYTSIRASASAIPVAGDAHSREVTLQVDPRDLAWTLSSDGGQECAVTAATASFSAASTPLEIQSHHFTANLPASVNTSQTSQPAVINFTVTLSSQASRLRVVVRDETTGHMGTADIPSLAAKP